MNHRLHIGIGSNLGDRQSNVLAALQRLRSRARIAAVSSFHESEASGGAEGPPYLNVAAEVETELDREAFERFAREVELAVGRAAGSVRKLAPRPIDIDVLAVDGHIVRPDIAQRPYNAVPLAEIAPQLVSARPDGAVRKRARSLHFDTDRQEAEPDVRLSLNRAGVSNLRRVVHLDVDGRDRAYNAEFAMVADLALDKSGVHMSRFTEILEEATLDVLARDAAPARIERFAEAIAREIIQNHRALSADVRLRALFGLERWTPVSGKRAQESYTLVGIAHADADGTRSVVGVEAEGMTACPCAQAMVREHGEEQLREAGFSQSEAERALDALPLATHNQRGRGSVFVGASDGRGDAVRAEDLVEIVENAMSSETYDLLKRPDEFFIVKKAHANPKFVEDVVRGILANALDLYADFPDETFLFAEQINYESIHKHDAFAQAFGTFGEFRQELRSGRRVAGKTDLASWLHTRPSAVLL
jgi:GTP cyclohydrolase IV